MFIQAPCISVEFSQIDANHNAMKADHSCENNVPQKENEESEKAIYENLAIPISKLPVYIQKMKERGDGFQKEFQVSHCYVCL